MPHFVQYKKNKMVKKKVAFFNFKEYNVADWISFFRIVLTPFLFLFIFLNEKFMFAVLLIISFISDALDGFLARRLKIVSERGAFLDSFGDILLLIAAIFGAFWFEGDVFLKNKVLLLIVFSLFIFLGVFAYIKYKRLSSFHTYLAKIIFVLIGFFFSYLFFFGFNQWFFNLIIIVGIIEILEEIVLVFLLPKHKSNVKGIYWVLKKSK